MLTGPRWLLHLEGASRTVGFRLRREWVSLVAVCRTVFAARHTHVRVFDQREVGIISLQLGAHPDRAHRRHPVRSFSDEFRL